MAEVAVFASGSGSNFEAIVKGLGDSPHTVCCLICDRKAAAVFERAKRLGVPAHYVTYYKRSREEAEQEIRSLLAIYQPQLIALAGFMRLFTADFAESFHNKIVNIHPALLPKHPGAHGIADSYASADSELGVTIHFVDHGLDSGPIIRQESFARKPGDTLEVVEERIHAIEHRIYPEVIRALLDTDTIKKEYTK